MRRFRTSCSGMSEPIGGWIADRLMVAGWSETRARKGIITFAFLTGLAADSRRARQQPGAAVALIIGGCLVGLATGNMLVDPAELRAAGPEIGLWTGHLQLRREHRGHPLANHDRRADCQDRIVCARHSCWRRC